MLGIKEQASRGARRLFFVYDERRLSFSEGWGPHESRFFERGVSMTATKRKTVPPSDDPVATPVVENATAPPPARENRGPAKSTAEGQPAAFPIVGIGASAGGLAAIEEFLAALPAERCSDLALVIVQHLDPDHKSILLELVAKYTQLDVAWAKDGVEVRRGAAYVLPPNKDMALVGGHLVLVDPELPRGRRLPIDYFFRSLAADQHEHAV